MEMFNTVIVVYLVGAAAMFNAIMDTISHHFYESIFNKRDKVKWVRFWNAEISWKNKYVDYDPAKGRKKWVIIKRGSQVFLTMNKPVQLTDGWHMMKSLMLVSIIAAVSVEAQTGNPFIALILLGIYYNLCFRAFYKVILIKNSKLIWFFTK